LHPQCRSSKVIVVIPSRAGVVELEGYFVGYEAADHLVEVIKLLISSPDQ